MSLETFKPLLQVTKEAAERNEFPKVIHKIWWQSLDELPEKYVQPLLSWRVANPDWKMVVWDQDSIRKLLRTYFPEHQQLFDSYPRMIQKIDAAKYFILAKFGGCYSDMDQCCLKALSSAIKIESERASILVSPLTEKRSLIPITSGFCFAEPPFFNNAFILAKPNPEVWKAVFDQLRIQAADKRLRKVSPLRRNPEIRVLRTTGPVCFTKALRKVIRESQRRRTTAVAAAPLVRVLDPQLVEPYSIYFKMGDPRYFEQLLAHIQVNDKAIAVSSMPSSWTNAHSRKGVGFKLIRKYVQFAYYNDLKIVMSQKYPLAIKA